MSIPEYIINAAREYSNGDENLFNAFIAGHKATKQPKTKHIVLTSEQESMFEHGWTCYGRKGNKALAKKIWSDIPVSTLPLVVSHINAYVGSRERRFQKDFERYLRDGEYRKIVFRGNSVVFDPQQYNDSNEYHPITDGIFQYWDDKRKCLMFNGYIDQLNDGYTKDNRPDGAKVVWQMYSWIWSTERKEWVKQND